MAAVLLAFANYAIGFLYVSTIWLGGTASHGKVVDGHYYLGNGGEYVEVGKQLYEFNLKYEIISGLALAAAIIFLLLIFLFLKVTGRWKGTPRSILDIATMSCKDKNGPQAK